MRDFKLCFTAILLFLTALTGKAADDESLIGVSVVVEKFYPTLPELQGQYRVNPLPHLDIAPHQGQEAVTMYLNMMGIGRKILDHLIGYHLGDMDMRELDARLQNSDAAQASDEALQAALMSNYVIAVQLDEKSREHALSEDTAQWNPRGKWYLYQLVIDKAQIEELKRCIPHKGDSWATRGEKRTEYENTSLPMMLVAEGEGDWKHTDADVRKIIRRITENDVRRGHLLAGRKKWSKAAKILLAPAIIVQ